MSPSLLWALVIFGVGLFFFAWAMIDIAGETSLEREALKTLMLDKLSEAALTAKEKDALLLKIKNISEWVQNTMKVLDDLTREVKEINGHIEDVDIITNAQDDEIKLINVKLQSAARRDKTVNLNVNWTEPPPKKRK